MPPSTCLKKDEKEEKESQWKGKIGKERKKYKNVIVHEYL